MGRFGRKGDGLGPRDLSSMSVRDTKLGEKVTVWDLETLVAGERIW